MRSASKLFSAILLFAGLNGIALSQCGPYSCGTGSCPPPPYCPNPYGAPYFQGYGASSSNYYQAPPPYLMGGPAYGYTYPSGPYGYAAYPSGPPSYIAPPYYSNPYATTSTQSFYNPHPQYLPAARAATAAVPTTPAAAPAKTTPPATKTASATPAKKAAAAPTKQASSTGNKDGKTATTDKQATDSRPPSIWRRLIWW